MKLWILFVLLTSGHSLNGQTAGLSPFQMMFAGLPAQPPAAETGIPGAAEKLAFGLGDLGVYTATGIGSALSNAVGSVASILSGVLGRGNYNTHTPSSIPTFPYPWNPFLPPGMPSTGAQPGLPQLPGIGNNPLFPGIGNNPQFPGMGNNPQLPGMGNNPQLPGMANNPQFPGFNTQFPGGLNPQFPGFPGLPGLPGQVPQFPGGQLPNGMNPGGQFPTQPGVQFPGQPGGQFPGQPGGQFPGQPGGQFPGQPGGQPGRPGQQPGGLQQPGGP